MRPVAGFLLALFLLQCAHGLLTKSGTCDELGAHLPSGILYWKSGRFAGGLANPPLGQLMVAAGPVLTGTADRPLRDDPRALAPARAPVVALGLATVLLIGAFARRLDGPVAGAAALGAAALSPNLVAHSRLATLDLPVTAFFAMATWAAWRWGRSGQAVWLAAWGVAAGAACLTKHSALHLLPAVTVAAFLAGGTVAERARRAAWLAAAGAAGLLATAWLAYGAGEAQMLLPAPYVEALVDKWEHGRAGHLAYLFGQRSPDGFPHYFAVALLVKTPLPLLIAAGVGFAALIRARAAGDVSGFAWFVLFPALWILAALSFVHRVDIGLRHVLPALPALLAIAGLGWAALHRGGRFARAASVVIAAWAVVTAARITPHHLAFFHELAGGPERGDQILIDSNLDWGQDDGALRAWAAGRDVAVNPDRPVEGLVAANVNAIHGVLSPDDSRLRWLGVFPAERTFGHTWRVFRTSEEPLRTAAARSPVRALDYAGWLLATGRPEEAVTLLERNDLSGHPVHAAEWWRRVAESRLAAGNLAGAASAAPRSGDVDLTVEVAYRLSELRGTPWPARDERERRGAFGALTRRGHGEEARLLGRRIVRDFPDHAFPELTRLSAPAPAAPEARLAVALTRRELGDEEGALRDVGALLADAPAFEDALWLYGELVVRRKLGLSEYPWPDVDWSAISRTSGAARP